jgi:hypothetical protein
MGANVKAGGSQLFSTFTASASPIELCAGYTFKEKSVDFEGTKDAIRNLLEATYAKYQDVSYKLWVVVNLLSKIRNTYPGATLHDCDDGSDINPVRLGSTTLGDKPLKSVFLTSEDLLS